LSSSLKTKLITPEGYAKLKNEHDELWYEQRPEITKIVTWAASLGDRSENADYQYNKRKLREIDRRVRYLRKLLPELKIVSYSPQQQGKVFFGASVEIENEAGDKKQFRIVGPEEIYGDAKGYISIDSPMARALLSKQVDDVAVVSTPAGDRKWYINTINYKKA
jgi:transcription elongation factor GreB